MKIQAENINNLAKRVFGCIQMKMSKIREI